MIETEIKAAISETAKIVSDEITIGLRDQIRKKITDMFTEKVDSTPDKILKGSTITFTDQYTEPPIVVYNEPELQPYLEEGEFGTRSRRGPSVRTYASQVPYTIPEPQQVDDPELAQALLDAQNLIRR